METRARLSLAVTAAVAAACAAGWLALAWLVRREPFGDAVNEAFGVLFGVLILLSVIGALRARSRANSGEDPENRS
ncbi:MAG: hypothetical protein HOV71_13230 [Hamadaea sp.]|uniref:hypothetical protein n=1 Tax=Hamadaea sp. NPDC050747 TaxID=3155789 RepID=UPI0017FA8179|nr:hypothetical protein [Hamadaea sp.]NUR49091.1 hypothetical protein [Hamadaea sp.]NUT07425.1 hypothetical protein [Hamadaea sp.]